MCKKVLAVLAFCGISALAGAATEPTYVFGPNTPNFLVGSQGVSVNTEWALLYGHKSSDLTKVQYVVVDATSLGIRMSLSGTGRLNYSQANQGDQGNILKPWWVSGTVTLSSADLSALVAVSATGSQASLAAQLASASYLQDSVALTVTQWLTSVTNANGGTVYFPSNVVSYELREPMSMSATETGVLGSWSSMSIAATGCPVTCQTLPSLSVGTGEWGGTSL